MSAINWLEWGSEAFRQAQEGDKPILLAIGATWCHWCHVMDNTTYSDPQVAELINREFIPVRVDTDRRPDVNDRYNMGGWPTTCFLTPDGDIVAGATYIPPENMLNALQQVKHHFEHNREAVVMQAREIKERSHLQRSTAQDTTATLTNRIVEDVTDLVLASYDFTFGGFGTGQKFPAPDALELMLDRYYHTRRPAFIDVVKKTLEAQRGGGMYDQEAGGFYRYSTTRDWTIPHFEKMLEDHAGHLRTYAQAFGLTGHQWYLDVIHHAMGYLEGTLRDPQRGVFYGSQDADEEYYSLPMAERRKHTQPYVDRTIYTDWNARISSALLQIYAATRDEKYLTHALQCLDWLLTNARQPDGPMFHYHDGRQHLPGLLQDQSAVLLAVLDAYEATGDSRFLTTGLELAGYCISSHWDSAEGGFFDVSPDHESLGRLEEPQKLMSLNSLISRAFIKLHLLTDQEEYHRYAEGALQPFTGAYRQWGHLASSYGLAVDALLTEAAVAIIIGPRDDQRTRSLANSALWSFNPHKAVQMLDPSLDHARIDQLGFGVKPEPTAYVCVGQACLAPTNDPEQLSELLTRHIALTPA
jgi:uncharacterized protein